MRYRVNILDLDGNVLQESDPVTKEVLVKDMADFMTELEETKDGHHIIIYPVDAE